ncbi:hypothetical protein NEMBOFW57_008108 [Staphylotrichum longicolle]|uniref:Uncharacterized protein n=1 Tax=Staphylotrichum longicolle TaxID=669026 RepID=A0AAD4HTX5_9PEZI|nr:hypothetical protein NEMBOFW57_008108 [Staphylotrichum longicolle]
MQAEQQKRHRGLENGGMEDQGAVLDAAVAVQLVAKTTSLSISGLANEPEDVRSAGTLQVIPHQQTSHHLRHLSLAPYIHHARLRRTRALLPPLLSSPSRPSRLDLIRRSIFLTHTAFASRRLARSLVSIRLARHLASRPSAEALVERCVLPPECLPLPARDSRGGGAGFVFVAPALVARKRAVERERVKDGLRGWVGSVWRGQVR